MATQPTHAPVVTGMGAVSALGTGCASMRAALDDGRDGITRITRFSTAQLGSVWGATVPGTAGRARGSGSDQVFDLCVELARIAAAEAWADANVQDAGLPAERIALVLGTSVGGHALGLYRVSEAVAAHLGLRGPALTVSTACASSAGALDLARTLLERGDADLVVAGGADALSIEVFAGFSALGLLCPEKCAPFGQPFGTTLGEGAGFLVLESAGQARARGARVRVGLTGFGLSADGYHATSPDPTGGGVARAMKAAIDDAALATDDVGYVNAHGTGTAANDTAEWKAIRTVFGARADRLPVSATKSYLGHAQAAAGVLELIATVLCIERDLIPPTLRRRTARAFCPTDPVAGERPRSLSVARALCTSSAFGGANAVVVVDRAAPEPTPRPRAPVFVLGSGWVGPAGAGSGRHPEAGGAVPRLDLRALVPSFDGDDLDPASRFLVGATARALADAGVAVRGSLRTRAGLLVGASVVSPSSAAELHRSIAERGLAQLSAIAFTRLVLNAPTGVACQALGLRGPTNTVSIGAGSGLLAIVYAAERLCAGRDADVLVAGACDERAADETGASEGAACVVLGRVPAAVRAAGWAVGPAGDFAATATAALARAGLGTADVEVVHGDAGALAAWARTDSTAARVVAAPAAPAAQSAFAMAAAFALVRRGAARVVLVGSADSASASVALVLLADDHDHAKERS